MAQEYVVPASGNLAEVDEGKAMPLSVYAFAIGIFSVAAGEFIMIGLMPSLAAAFDVTISQIGYLISTYSAGMVIGGPLLTIALLRLTRRSALLLLLAIDLGGQVLAAMATDYTWLAVARVISGAASASVYAVSISAAAEIVGPRLRGRSSSIVLAGLMVATVIGLPALTMVDQFYGWRAAFWAVAIVTLLAAAIIAATMPTLAPPPKIDLKTEIAELKNGGLWCAYATSVLIIAATFAAFSYFAPIFIDISGFSPATLPYLFAMYGVATVVGNFVVGRFADRYTFPILFFGLSTLTVILVVFALFAHIKAIAVIAAIVIGLIGVTMNPAMIARVMRSANPRPLVNSVHSTFISLGVLTGSWLGGLAIGSGFGTLSALWVGVGLALLGLASIAPRQARRLAALPA